MKLLWCVAADAVERLPVDHGAYVLEWQLREALSVPVRGGPAVELGPGRVVYVGSAWGPGGLVARVGRHLRPASRRDHWHVDRLTRAARPDRVGWRVGGRECDVVEMLLAEGWTTPVPGFGASDCRRCVAHLVAKTG
jgi:Uri superfamily endonuclease